jgi:hypothetical protein
MVGLKSLANPVYSLLFKEVRIFLTKGATAACTTAVLIGVVAEQAGMARARVITNIIAKEALKIRICFLSILILRNLWPG